MSITTVPMTPSGATRRSSADPGALPRPADPITTMPGSRRGWPRSSGAALGFRVTGETLHHVDLGDLFSAVEIVSENDRVLARHRTGPAKAVMAGDPMTTDPFFPPAGAGLRSRRPPARR